MHICRRSLTTGKWPSSLKAAYDCVWCAPGEVGILTESRWLVTDVSCGSRGSKMVFQELSKRTTFIMVTQQLNEVFGEAQASMAPVVPKL